MSERLWLAALFGSESIFFPTSWIWAALCIFGAIMLSFLAFMTLLRLVFSCAGAYPPATEANSPRIALTTRRTSSTSAA